MSAKEDLVGQNEELQREITKLSKELEKVKKNYVHTMDNTKNIIFNWNSNGDIIYANKYTEYYFGLNQTELRTKSINDFFFKKSENPETIFNKITKEYKVFQKEYETFETEHQGKDGEISWISWNHVIIKDEKENVDSILSIGNDITQFKRTEQKLRESEEKYRNILENIKEGYFEVNLEGIFLHVNDAFCVIIQYSREEIINTKYDKFTDEKNRNLIYSEFHDVFKTKKDRGMLLVTFKNKNKRKVIIETSVYLRYDQLGNIIGFIGLCRDVTQLKRAEQKLKKSEQKYREAFGRADMFKDLIIHDINNILQIIQSSTEIYQISADAIDKDEMISLIQKNVRRGTKLVQNAVKLSKIEDSEISLKNINLIQFLNNSLDIMNKKFGEREIYMKLDIPKENIHVKANELLTDVFENILFNAVKYCEKKVLTLYIKVSILEDKNQVKLEFKDNGIGIQDDRKKLIFQTYGKKKGSKGLGFGLSIVKKIIDMYKGSIWVENAVQGDYTQGSNFILLLPIIS